MAARALGTGSISFGLVNIPVKIYSANESGSRISFHQLHKKCRSRLKQQLYCPTDNEVVSRDDIVKGYEFAKDQYVLFTDEELEALEAEASKAIEISEFVPLSSIDPLYFETGYYLGPDKGAERAFKLLSVALHETQHAAVASHNARGRQYLVLLRPMGDGLVMQQLRHAHEIKPATEVPLGEATVKEGELKLAKQFIENLSNPSFDATKYKDERRERLLEIIDSKVKGEPVTFAPSKPASPQVVDLMEALKASLSKAASKSGEKAPALAAVANDDGRKPPKRSPRSPTAGSEKPTAASEKKVKSSKR